MLELLLAVALGLLLARRVLAGGLDATTLSLGLWLLSWSLVSTSATLGRPAGRWLTCPQTVRPGRRPPRF